MKESDIKHLRCIYERISTHVRKDNDYMIKFKSIIDELEKENMPETKRWRLEIPEDVQREFEELKWAWHYENGNIIDENMSISISKPFSEWKSRFSDLPKSWLVEIKEESRPCMANEYAYAFNSCHPNLNLPKDIIIQIFESGIKATELKHQETESCEEAFQRIGKNHTVTAHAFCLAWEAANKSRGY